jgi:cysteine synthase
VAILPQGMSKERFEWLRTMAEEVIATPGCESNVKEIFDKCIELERTRPEAVIFNQFDQLPNSLWHYNVTGPAMEEVFRKIARPGDVVAGAVLSSGSAGTMAAGSYLRDTFPGAKVGVAEALQCPTILENGFGDHRIEGIGDKHIPWIHNMRETDAAIGVDDELPIRFIRLFNEAAGQKLLAENGVSQDVLEKLEWMGISSIGNMIGAIKFAKYYELGENDVVFTVFTDSMAMYQSRLEELKAERGVYDQRQADRDYDRLSGISLDYVLELSQVDKRRVHQLKYFSWVEQLGKSVEELRAQWDDHRNYWGCLRTQSTDLDVMIEEFNAEAGAR